MAITIHDGSGFGLTLAGIEGFEHIWVSSVSLSINPALLPQIQSISGEPDTDISLHLATTNANNQISVSGLIRSERTAEEFLAFLGTTHSISIYNMQFFTGAFTHISLETASQSNCAYKGQLTFKSLGFKIIPE